MKRLTKTLLAIACIAVSAVSCYKDGPGKGDEPGSICGTWVLDTKTVLIETSFGGNDNQNKTEIDFKGLDCRLSLEYDQLAHAAFGYELEVTTYSYDAESQRLDFSRQLSVSSSGRTMTLVGQYDVTQLTQEKLVLTQKSGVTIGSSSAYEVTTYEFHRKPDDNSDETIKEKQY
ncbi:MAG: hypothetical protein II874_07220 [Bacteroidales bacterium]|nr:hypothetical protein [Bacteroidales bacterium]